MRREQDPRHSTALALRALEAHRNTRARPDPTPDELDDNAANGAIAAAFGPCACETIARARTHMLVRADGLVFKVARPRDPEARSVRAVELDVDGHVVWESPPLTALDELGRVLAERSKQR